MRLAASMTAIAVALGSTAAVAQTTTTPSTTPSGSPTAPAARAPAATTPATPAKPVEGQITQQQMDTVLASDLMKATVYAPDNSKIGSVSDVLMKRDGSAVEGIVVGVGGFLGIGEKWVAVKLDKVRMSEQNGALHLVLNSTKDDLKAAPAFKTKAEQQSEMNRTAPATAPATSPASTPAR